MAELEYHGQLEAIREIADLAMRETGGRPFLRINVHATREGGRYHIDSIWRSDEFDGDRPLPMPPAVPIVFEKLGEIHRDGRLRYFERCRISIAAEHQILVDYDFGDGYTSSVSLT